MEKTLNSAEVIERIGKVGLLPVVVISNVDDAIPTAKALLKAEIDIMEITMRTEQGIEAIRKVSAELPEMLVGAGTVLNVKKAEESVAAGAKFIVSPGFNPSVVDWCINNNIAVTPGCVTPTEITMALAKDIRIVKFFPGDVYGGVKACSSLYGPFAIENVKFIPTGGVNNENLSEFANRHFIHAVGGSWLCPEADISERNFDKITALAKKAVNILLGFEFAHVGVYTNSSEESEEIIDTLFKEFDLPVKKGNSSNFAGNRIEVTKSQGAGINGHIAIGTNSIERAIYYLAKRGFMPDMDTTNYKNNALISVYLKNEVGGFALHLLKK